MFPGQPRVSVLTLTLFETGFLAHCSVHQAKEPWGFQSAGSTAVCYCVQFYIASELGSSCTHGKHFTHWARVQHTLSSGLCRSSHLETHVVQTAGPTLLCIWAALMALVSKAKKRSESGKELCLEGPQGVGGDELGWIWSRYFVHMYEIIKGYVENILNSFPANFPKLQG